MSSARFLLTVAILLLITSCGDNLNPSGSDKRPAVVAGTPGPAVGQKALDFSVSQINGTVVTLADTLNGRKGAVFYFTMWCPICDGHMNNMRGYVAPLYTDVGFYLVDYVSGSVTDAAVAAGSSGFDSGSIITLADLSHQIQNNFVGTMGTTVVVDSTGIIRMNEDYKDGVKLQSILSQL